MRRLRVLLVHWGAQCTRRARGNFHRFGMSFYRRVCEHSMSQPFNIMIARIHSKNRIRMRTQNCASAPAGGLLCTRLYILFYATHTCINRSHHGTRTHRAPASSAHAWRVCSLLAFSARSATLCCVGCGGDFYDRTTTSLWQTDGLVSEYNAINYIYTRLPQHCFNVLLIRHYAYTSHS